MADWIEKELATATFVTNEPKPKPKPKAKTSQTKAPPRKTKPHKEKLKRRFRLVLEAMSQKPSLKFPASCRGRAEVKGAYAFLDNQHVTALSILGPHRDATIERIRMNSVALIAQDTTELDVTRPDEVMLGAGPLNDSSRVGLYDHASLAMTPERLSLGVVDVKIWARDPVEFEKDAAQKRTERRAKAIEQKESVRWVEGYQAACLVAIEAPETHIISLADSEGDIFEYLLAGEPVEGIRKASFIIRACQNRALVASAEASFSELNNHLREQVATTPVLTERLIEVRERNPKSKDARKRKQPRVARTATVTVQAARVKLRGPARPGGKLKDVEVNVVLIKEVNAPPGAEPIEWILLTDLPIDTVTAVELIIEYYACRWQIEIYFRILKSGCKVEESQLETTARFEPYLALCMIVAWRVFYVMMLGRECADLPCDIAFEDDEWRAVYAMVKKEPPPAEAPTMQTMVRLIASLGGWLGRKCDGEPGPKAMWIGMQRMTDLAAGWRVRGEQGVPAVKPAPGSRRSRE